MSRVVLSDHPAACQRQQIRIAIIRIGPAERIDDLRAQLETKQAKLEAERGQRLAAEDRVARFRVVADRLKERVTGPEDDELQALLAELEELEGEKKTVETLAQGVSVLADDLEDAP